MRGNLFPSREIEMMLFLCKERKDFPCPWSSSICLSGKHWRNVVEEVFPAKSSTHFRCIGFCIVIVSCIRTVDRIRFDCSHEIRSNACQRARIIYALATPSIGPVCSIECPQKIESDILAYRIAYALPYREIRFWITQSVAECKESFTSFNGLFPLRLKTSKVLCLELKLPDGQTERRMFLGRCGHDTTKICFANADLAKGIKTVVSSHCWIRSMWGKGGVLNTSENKYRVEGDKTGDGWLRVKDSAWVNQYYSTLLILAELRRVIIPRYWYWLSYTWSDHGLNDLVRCIHLYLRYMFFQHSIWRFQLSV